jgi:cell division protein FtsW
MGFLGERASQALRLDELEGRFDPWLLTVTIVLAGFGVVMVASSSMPYAMNNGLGPFYYLERHLMFLTGGVVLAVVLMRTEMKRIQEHSQYLLPLCLLLLLSVWVPGLGHTINGARRWLNLGVSNFQVVEAVKLLLIVWMASYLVRYQNVIGDSWKALLKPLIAAGVLVGLLLLQPDFGSAMLILAVTGGMVWLGGARIRNLALPAGAGLLAMSFIVMLEPYRVRRLTSFQNPWADPRDSGYQLVQALIAIGRGDWAGVGLGGSILKLDYLPEAHTDFIFSVTAEEFGFLGVCTIIALFAILTWRAMQIGLRCIEMRRHFSGYCAFGVGLWISLQAFVSMGVNLGILPTKGLTLPLISSGGSSVLMTCAAMGMLLRVSYELDRAERKVAILRGQSLAPEMVSNDDALDDAPRPAAPQRMAAAATMPATRGHRVRIEPRLGAQR